MRYVNNPNLYFIRSFASKRNDINLTKWKLVTLKHSQQQVTDGRNCGIYASAFVDHLFKSKSLYFPNKESDLLNIRKQIKEVIEKNSLKNHVFVIIVVKKTLQIY